MVRISLVAAVVGIVTLFSAMDVEASAEIVTGPLLLIGLGLGGLASQLGAVTVSAVPDDLSPEVGGLQNTATQFGASLGTALAGSVLIGSLTASFLTGIADNPAVPNDVVSQADVKLASGAPFISDADIETALRDAGVDTATSGAVLDVNQQARLDGLQSALALLAIIGVLALFFTKRVPTRQPGSAAAARPPPSNGRRNRVDRLSGECRRSLRRAPCGRGGTGRARTARSAGRPGRSRAAPPSSCRRSARL